MKTKRPQMEYIACALPLLLALVCILSVSLGSHQASLPVPMPQELVGEYSYDGENWMQLTEDADISALEGDLMFRGHFLREMQEGVQMNFYRNHIGVSVYLNGEVIYMDEIVAMGDIDTTLFASMCAREWINFTVSSTITPEDTVEIRLHNPHRAGNRTAYRDFLSTLCCDVPGWNILQMQLEPHGNTYRAVGGLLMITALLLFGAAIAAVAVRIPVGSVLLLFGLLTFFAGGFMLFDTIDVSYWNELNALNTYGKQLCMMLAVFFLGRFVSENLTGKRQKIAKCAVLLSALLNSVLILLSFTGVTVIFDTLPYWVASQLILCPLMMVCCVLELRSGQKDRLIPATALPMFAAVLLDIGGVGSNIVWRSPCSKVVFMVLFAVHVVVGASGIVKNHRASMRVAKLEKELEDSRIAIMLSQIKPHFLYNVLNTIYHLYRKEPETAQEAVSSFAEYLRCNMLSIEKNEPILFAEEYRHIQTYLSLEQIRFRGKLDVIYDVEVTDFKLPPLTVEPLVENAVKHGVTKKRGGGIVTISTGRTEDSYVVTVADTGVGFDPDHYEEDGKAHIGIRNVRDRLHSMVGGTLTITSTPEGTVARVTVPAKEANHRNENHRG